MEENLQVHQGRPQKLSGLGLKGSSLDEFTYRKAKPALTPKPKRRRLQRAKEKRSWSVDDRGMKEIFSDESPVTYRNECIGTNP